MKRSMLLRSTLRKGKAIPFQMVNIAATDVLATPVAPFTKMIKL